MAFVQDLTVQVEKLRAEIASLNEESHELTQEKNYLGEEEASLKSATKNLNVQYQQRLRAMFPWSAIDPSVVVRPPSYLFPVPVLVHIPTGSIPMHPSMQLQWSSCRIAGGFLSNKLKLPTRDEDPCLKSDSSVSPSKKKPLVFSFILSFQFRNQTRSHECPHIVVATPGRILALARDKDLALKNVRRSKVMTPGSSTVQLMLKSFSPAQDSYYTLQMLQQPTPLSLGLT